MGEPLQSSSHSNSHCLHKIKPFRILGLSENGIWASTPNPKLSITDEFRERERDNQFSLRMWLLLNELGFSGWIALHPDEYGQKIMESIIYWERKRSWEWVNGRSWEWIVSEYILLNYIHNKSYMRKQVSTSSFCGNASSFSQLRMI